MLNAEHNICSGKWDAQTSLGFWGTKGSSNLGHATRPYNNNHLQQENYRIMDFAVPASHRIKLKESEKKNTYIDLMCELKKPWKMKVTFIPIVIGALGIVTEGLLQGLEDLKIRGQVETTQTTASLRSARILRRVLETWEDLSLKLQWKNIG